MSLTLDMLAAVQYLMMAATGTSLARLERIETYLIDRINRG